MQKVATSISCRAMSSAQVNLPAASSIIHDEEAVEWNRPNGDTVPGFAYGKSEANASVLPPISQPIRMSDL